MRGLPAATRLTQDIGKRTPTRNRGQQRTPSAQVRESVTEAVDNLCHAHVDCDPVPQGDNMRGLYVRLTKDSVD